MNKLNNSNQQKSGAKKRKERKEQLQLINKLPKITSLFVRHSQNAENNFDNVNEACVVVSSQVEGEQAEHQQQSYLHDEPEIRQPLDERARQRRASLC